MHQVNVDEATAQLPSLIDAAVHGEVVLITTHAKQPRRPGSARGMIHMADDFGAPLDDFREYSNPI